MQDVFTSAFETLVKESPILSSHPKKRKECDSSLPHSPSKKVKIQSLFPLERQGQEKKKEKVKKKEKRKGVEKERKKRKENEKEKRDWDAKIIFQTHHDTKMTKEELECANAINKTRSKLLEWVKTNKIVYPVNTDRVSCMIFRNICQLPLHKQDGASSSTQSNEHVDDKESQSQSQSPSPKGYAFLISQEERSIIPFFTDIPFAHVIPLNPSDYAHVISSTLIYALERKSSDLTAALHNGRYRDQTERMKGLPVPRCQLGFLHEQPKKSFKRNKDVSTLRSCQSSKIFRDGMTWRRSDGILDTVLMLYKDILAILEKGCFYYDTYCLKTPKEKDEQFLIDSIGKRMHGGRPKDNLTPKKVWEMQLANIPGVGSKRASAVTGVYANIKELVHAYDKCETVDERETLLQGLECTEVMDKRSSLKDKQSSRPHKSRRKINEQISKTIYEFIYKG